MNVIEQYKQAYTEWEDKCPERPSLKVGDFTVFIEVFEDVEKIEFCKWAPYQGGGCQTHREFRTIQQAIDYVRRGRLVSWEEFKTLKKWLNGE
jgi:hypothetical protein